MGTCYTILCHTCKVQRDLDKFGSITTVCKTRADMLSFADTLEQTDSFRAALALTFFMAHRGHDVKVLDDCGHDELFEEPIASYNKEDFWSP